MNKLVSKRYGAALFKVADEKGILGDVNNDLHLLSDLFSKNEIYNFFFTSGALVKSSEIKTVIKSLENTLTVTTINLLYLLVDKKRFYLFEDIKTAYSRYVEDRLGNVKGIVYSASNVSEGTLRDIEKSCSAFLKNNNLHLVYEHDPMLLGGIKLRIKNSIYEYYISKKLLEMKKKMLKLNIEYRN